MGACKATGNSSRLPASTREHALKIRTRSPSSSRDSLTRDRHRSCSTSPSGRFERFRAAALIEPARALPTMTRNRGYGWFTHEV